MHKKYMIGLLLALAFTLPLFGTILLDQNFDSVTVPNLPSGWVLVDGNSDSKTWATTTSHPHSLNNCIRYNYSRTNGARDWFITGPLSLYEDIDYTLEFFYRGSNPSFTEKVRVWLLTAQDTSSKYGSAIYDNNNITNTIYAQALEEFEVGDDDTYYLGFECYSDANQWNLRIDDIKVYVDEHDVGVSAVIVPLNGSQYQVGDTIIPKIVVRNYGQNTGGEIVPVHVAIVRMGNDTIYEDSTTIRVEICTPETISLDTCIFADPCNHQLIAWTELDEDMDNSNDTAYSNFTVNYHDVAVDTILIPSDTLTWCTESIPTVIISNRGHATETFKTYFKIYRADTLKYSDSLTVTAMAAQTFDTLEFRKYHFPICNYTAIAYTALTGDQNRYNDTIMKNFTVQYIDAEIVDLIAPDTIRVCTTFKATIRIHNAGVHHIMQPGWWVYYIYGNYLPGPGESKNNRPTFLDRASFMNYLTNTDNEFHEDSIYVNAALAPCETLNLLTDTIHFFEPCEHFVAAFADYPGDQDWDNNYWWHDIIVKYTDAELVSIVAPDTVVVRDSFDVTVRIHNAGYHVALYPGYYVHMEIGQPVDNSLPESILVTDTLWPCETLDVTFHTAISDTCWHVIYAHVDYPGDQNTSNNYGYKNIWSKKIDLEVSYLDAPDTVNVGDTFDVHVKVHNNGIHSIILPGWPVYLYAGFDKDSKISGFYDTLWVEDTLYYCDTAYLTFRALLREPCNQIVYVWINYPGDQNTGNDQILHGIVGRLYDFELISPIIGVPDTVRVCTTITPRVAVHNNGVHVGEQDATVYFEVYRNGYLVYEDDYEVDDLAEEDVDTVDFEWHADSACFHEIVVWVEADEGDANHYNDTLRQDFIVKYNDVEAVALLDVPDSIDVCHWMFPRVVVHSLSQHVEPVTGWVHFEVWRMFPDADQHYMVYHDSVEKTLEYCVYDTVNFKWHADSGCYHTAVAYVVYDPDQNPYNDTTEEVDFIVRFRDVSVDSIVLPGDTVTTCTSFNPIIEIGNNGMHVGAEICTVDVRIWRYKIKMDSLCHISMDTTRPIVVYDTWVVASVDPGSNMVNMPAWHPYWSDIFWGSCTTHHTITATVRMATDTDSTNNMLTKHFIVKARRYDLQVNYVGLLRSNTVITTDTISVGVSYNPVSVVSNSPSGPAASFRSWLKIIRVKNNAVVYSRYLDRTLQAGQYACLYYQSGWVPSDSGLYLERTYLEFRPGVDSIAINNTMERYWYARLTTHDADNNAEANPTALPKVFALQQNYPNPIFATTMIKWQIPVQSKVRVSVYDATGRMIKTLINNNYEPGYYNTIWDCTDNANQKVSAGIYFYEMQATNFSSRYKMVIARQS